MAEVTDQDTDQQNGSVYRVAGTVNIARAATTQREIDALPDPLTIDLSDIIRMDTRFWGRRSTAPSAGSASVSVRFSRRNSSSPSSWSRWPGS